MVLYMCIPYGEQVILDAVIEPNSQRFYARRCYPIQSVTYGTEL